MRLRFLLTVALTFAMVISGHFAQAAAQIASLDFDVVVEDSVSYRVFRYQLTNVSASNWGIASLRLGIPATSGAPANLPATGDIVVIPDAGAVAPHAEVGPIAPMGWRSILSPLAELSWAPPNTRSFSADSVAPGASKVGFGIRSTYLPGINTLEAFPTTESCCRAPVDTTGGERIYSTPSQHAVHTFAVAPRFMPAEVDLDLVQSQLTAVCTDPLWIDDAAVCEELADSLDVAEVRLNASNFPGATTALEGVLATLEDEREPGGLIAGNAYWLLRINTEYVLSTIPGGPIVAPVTADTYLRQANPNQNQGTETILSLRASGRHRALLLADLPSVTGPVASARIEFEVVLNAENWSAGGRTIDAHRVLVSWTELGATWNCPHDANTSNSSANCPGAGWEMFTLNPAPYASSASGSLLVTNGLTGTVSIDVTADVQEMLSGQLTNHGWIVRKTDEGADGRIEIASSETASGPRLIIEMGTP